MTTQQYKSNLFKVSFFLMFVLVLFPSNIKSIVIAFFAVVMLLTISTEKLKFDIRFFIINALIYILLLISLIYSDDLIYATKKLETMASLFVFPFLFAFFSKNSLLKSKLENFKSYLIFYVLAVLILNVFLFLMFWLGEYSFSDTSKHYLFLIDNKLGKYNIHAIYMSMHICLAIIFSLFVLMKNYYRKFNYILILIVLLQLFFLLILNRKGPILSLLAIIALYVFFKGDFKKRLFFIASLVILILIISNNSRSRNQFKELINIEEVDESNPTSTNIRYTIYKCALEVVKKQPILGFGIGDSQKELLQVYKQRSMLLYNDNYNSHNQYLSFILSVGVVGFLLISYSFYFLIRKGIKQSNYLFLAIFIFYLVEMLFENILERENGVIFYSFFVSLLQITEKDEVII